jgi:bifunctional DNA-binding transcriptional regulator/antitoxin component of YhaV-PrlF toxin-antitoxin module
MKGPRVYRIKGHGNVTIPSDLQRELGWKEGTLVQIVKHDRHAVVVQEVKIVPDERTQEGP